MKNKITLILIALLVALFVGMGLVIKQQHTKIGHLNDDLMVATNNNKAYEAEKDSLLNNSIQFQFTVDQLNHSKDSLINRINEIRKQIKVKDKQLNELQYFVSENSKADSIIVHDTIFQKGVAIDTLLQDDWSKLAVHAEYPNVLNVDYSFRNETLVVMHDSRVTVDPPKKCWLGRLFQKKQTIVEIDVAEQNPYCTIKNQKFIKVVK